MALQTLLSASAPIDPPPPTPPRHALTRAEGREKETVIASEAIHRAAQRKSWLFRRFAPLRKRYAFVAGNDDRYTFAFSRRVSPEFCSAHSALLEGTGNAGRLVRPQPRVWW